MQQSFQQKCAASPSYYSIVHYYVRKGDAACPARAVLNAITLTHYLDNATLKP